MMTEIKFDEGTVLALIGQFRDAGEDGHTRAALLR